MSSTRHADADTPFRQERYASSAVYEPGLLGNLVAKRAKAIRRSQDRALVYWLQAQSHLDGGLQAFAERFLAEFADRIGTPTSRRLRRAAGEFYTLEESAALREELPCIYSISDFLPRPKNPEDYLTFQYLGDEWIDERTGCVYSHEERAELIADYQAATAPPAPLSVEAVARECQQAADTLPELLSILCLDPEANLEAVPLSLRVPGGSSWKQGYTASVWWFDDLVGALHECRRRQIEAARGQIAETTISRKVFAALDYAAQIQMREKLVLIEGDQRTGKSTAAEAWCALHPGEAVYVRLESGRDLFSFYRAIARAIGTASSGQMKALEMRPKIEDMLQERHLMVVIDEAHFLFLLVDRPKSAPDRTDWVRTALVDHGVPVVLVSTPQFDRQCDLWQKHIGWNAAQIRGRVKLHEHLPAELPLEDLEAVARKMAPQADELSVMRLVGFAKASDDYLAGIERLVCRADYFAVCAGRQRAGRADIKQALDEALPRLETVAPAPEPPARRKRASARATAPGKRAKGFGKDLPPTLARRAGLDMPADSPAAGSGAGERLQFTEEAASD